MTKETLKKFILPAAIAVAAVAAIIVAVVVSSNKEEIYRLIKVKSFEGAVTVQREEKMDAFEGLQLISEDSVEVGESSLLELLADSDKHIVAEENTAFVLHSTGTETSGNITIDLLYGKSLFTIDNKLNDESTFEVKTPNATMSVRGTSFSTEYDTAERATTVEVFDGVVHVTYDGGELLLEKGDAVTIKVNEDEMEVVEGANLDSNDQNSGNDGTEQLFYVGMTYAQEENYAKADAEYQFGFSEYVGETAENAELSNKIIEIVKAHSDEVNKYFESNKDLAAQNKTESEDITKWFEDTISIGDKYYSVDKVVMDIAVSGSSVEREYFTSDTYKVKSNGREMYYCASGVVFEFYGEVMEAPAVTTVSETTTTVTTTTPEITTTLVTTTVPETTTTPMTTTTVPETTTTTPATTTVVTDDWKSKYPIFNFACCYSINYNSEKEKAFWSGYDIEALNFYSGSLSSNILEIKDSDGKSVDLSFHYECGYRKEEQFNDIHTDEPMKPFASDFYKYVQENNENIKAIFNRYKKNNYESTFKKMDKYGVVDEDLDIDVSGWFPDTLIFESEFGNRKINIEDIKVHIYFSADNEDEYIESVHEDDYKIINSEDGKEYYFGSYLITFDFYGSYEEI